MNQRTGAKFRISTGLPRVPFAATSQVQANFVYDECRKDGPFVEMEERQAEGLQGPTNFVLKFQKLRER